MLWHLHLMRMDTVWQLMVKDLIHGATTIKMVVLITIPTQTIIKLNQVINNLMIGPVKRGHGLIGMARFGKFKIKKLMVYGLLQKLLIPMTL